MTVCQDSTFVHKTIGLIPGKYCRDIYGPQRMIYNKCGNMLTFHLAALGVKMLTLSCKAS